MRMQIVGDFYGMRAEHMLYDEVSLNRANYVRCERGQKAIPYMRRKLGSGLVEDFAGAPRMSTC